MTMHQNDELILVDEFDNEIGSLDKYSCHLGARLAIQLESRRPTFIFLLAVSFNAKPLLARVAITVSPSDRQGLLNHRHVVCT